jgi:hypothetical protein
MCTKELQNDNCHAGNLIINNILLKETTSSIFIYKINKKLIVNTNLKKYNLYVALSSILLLKYIYIYIYT